MQAAARCIGWAAGRIAPLAAVACALSLAAVTPAAAQQPAAPEVGATAPFEGRVVLGERPISDLTVSLHQVTSQGSGAVSVTVTDAAGEFSFPRPEDAGTDFAFFFATAEYQSVTFFGPIVRATDAPEEYLISVHDTASVLPEPVRVVTRHVVLIPEASGSWEVNEILGILNPTSLALVAEPGTAAWEFRIPLEATEFEVGPGEVLPHEIARMEDRVLHLTPVVPGEREIFVRYRLPADATAATLPVTDPIDTFNLFVRQPSHLTGVTGIQSQRMVDAGEERYLQYTATDLAPGAAIELRWSRPGPPVDPVVLAISLTVVLLVVAVVFAIRNRAPVPASS